MSDVALKEYFEKLIEAADRRYEQRFVSGDEAIAKAERTMNERLNSMNEFRDALKDQAARMATRVELETLDGQVQELRRIRANMEGRIAVMSAVVSMAVTGAILLLSHVLAP